MTVRNEIREVILELWYEFEQMELGVDEKEIEYAKRSKLALLKIAETLDIVL